MSTTPAIRTTVVGSYPVPDWLVAVPSEQALVDATKVVFQTQELAGIDVVVDGELYRFDVNHPDTNGMIDYFIRPMAGVRTGLSRGELAEFRRMEEMSFRAAPAGVVDGRIDEGTLNLPRDYARARGCTNHPLKFTVTGPHMLSKTLVDHHYRDRAALAHAIGQVLAKQVADIDPQVLQIDEANITGHPDEAPWAADAINTVFDAFAGVSASADTSSSQERRAPERALHMCFGNYGGQSIQKGTWAKLIDFMNRLHCDHVVLEFAFRGYDELAHFRDLRPEIAIGLGVIDVKVNTVETPDVVAQRIEHAERIVGPGRVTWVHPDCGFWMNKRSVADRKMAALVKGRDLYLGRKG